MAVSKLNPSASGIPFGNNAGRPTGAIGKLYSNGEEKYNQLRDSRLLDTLKEQTPPSII